MNTDNHGFKHGEITQKIIGVFYEVYNELGHGFLESVYEKSLEVATLRHEYDSRYCNPGHFLDFAGLTLISVALLLHLLPN